MAERDNLVYIVLGLFVGVPLGAFFLWLFTRPRSPSPTYVPTKTYSNVEEWEIVKDPATGRTKGLRVHRMAEEK